MPRLWPNVDVKIYIYMLSACSSARTDEQADPVVEDVLPAHPRLPGLLEEVAVQMPFFMAQHVGVHEVHVHGPVKW